MSEGYDAITVGSSTVDLFADTDRDELIEIHTNREDEELIAYPLGTKIPITELRQDIGGNGVNVAVGLARLGIDTAYGGKVGTDPNGELIMERLEKEGISFAGARGERSGMGIILDSHLEDDRTILGYKGCNNTLTMDDFDTVPQADLWYFSSMLEESWETMQELADHAHQAGSTIAFNPSSTIAVKGNDHLRPVLDKTDMVIVNEEEAEMIAEQGSTDENMDFLHEDIETVVITQGSEGVTAVHKGTRHEAPSRSCDVVETTGAGDAFSSGFLAGRLWGKSFEQSLTLGLLNAESVLCHYGAHNDLLDKERAEHQLAEDERNISQDTE